MNDQQEEYKQAERDHITLRAELALQAFWQGEFEGGVALHYEIHGLVVELLTMLKNHAENPTTTTQE